MDDARKLTRRGLLGAQAAAGAGYVAAGLLAGPLAADSAAAGAVALDPRFYPLSGFVPELDLRGKLAVVTGASTGIGRATAEALAARGVRVIGTSRDAASVSDRPRFALWDLDVSEAASIDAFGRKLRRRLGLRGRVDILVNNAGRGVIGDVLPSAGGEARYFEQLELGLATDFTGQLMVTRNVLPLLPARGYARVCFTVSISAYSVATGALAYLHGYVAAKRALLASANAWRSTLEQAGSNIRVTTINPYQVNTRWPYNFIYSERVRAGSALAGYLRALRQVYANGLPATLVGDAYTQLLSSAAPPANVAVGSAAEPAATMGNNALFHATALAENEAAALRFAG
jgi:NAD(P)-dependent dehydrogenase (short-subunit alcohol dehydrogenase family)